MIDPAQFDPFWYAVTMVVAAWVACIVVCIAAYIDKK